MDNGIQLLLGQTIKEINGEVGDDTLEFICESGDRFKMFHSQDCCESVYLEDISGELKDILGSPVLLAEERSNNDFDAHSQHSQDDSWTWSFYKIGTVKGFISLRWYGSSNGYYSESVEFVKL